MNTWLHYTFRTLPHNKGVHCVFTASFNQCLWVQCIVLYSVACSVWGYCGIGYHGYSWMPFRKPLTRYRTSTSGLSCVVCVCVFEKREYTQVHTGLSEMLSTVPTTDSNRMFTWYSRQINIEDIYFVAICFIFVAMWLLEDYMLKDFQSSGELPVVGTINLPTLYASLNWVGSLPLKRACVCRNRLGVHSYIICINTFETHPSDCALHHNNRL